MINKNKKIEDVFFFTALAFWNTDKVKRHNIYIKALEENKVKVIKGKFRQKDKYCNYCKKTTKTYEEKETDVNIAIYLLKLAFKDQYDEAMIISGDSDLIPAIREVKKEFPDKKITIIIPPFRKAHHLVSISDNKIKLTEKHLSLNQLPEKMICRDGSIIERPKEWN